MPYLITLVRVLGMQNLSLHYTNEKLYSASNGVLQKENIEYLALFLYYEYTYKQWKRYPKNELIYLL